MVWPWVLCCVLLGAGMTFLWWGRMSRERRAVEFDESVEYNGALKLVLEGDFPEFLKLLPFLPGRGVIRSSRLISFREKQARKDGERYAGDDITRLSTESDRQEAEDAVEITKTKKLHRASRDDKSEKSDRVGHSVMRASDPISKDDMAGDAVFRFPPEIIGEYDIRGIYGKNLHVRTAFYLGRALGGLARKQGENKVSISRDARFSSMELAQGLAKGLRFAGMNVINTGIIPTPVHYFGLRFLKIQSGVMVTGSHNPSAYNGFKIQMGGRPLWGGRLRRVCDGKFVQQEHATSGVLRGFQVSAEYVKQAVPACGRLPGASTPYSPPFKVVVDGANSIGGKFTAHLLREQGCQVVELYCDLDSSFPHHPPDPSQPENLKALMELVKSEGAQVGFALDGDADRLVLVDERGRILWPDQVLMFLAGDVLARYPGGKVIYDVKCSHHLDRHVRSLGGEPIMWKTGHSLIRDKIAEENAVLGGEMSGHLYLCRDWYPFDDGLFAALRLADLLRSAARPVSEVFAALPGGVASQEYRVPMPLPGLRDFVSQFAAGDAFPGAERIELDGLRVQFQDRWGLVRRSNTEPCLVFRFEGDDATALSRIQGEFQKHCERIAPNLKLPF